MLTDIQARKAQPRDKDYKLADAGGLYLFISAKGAKSWRLKYRFGGKEKRLVFGQYPEIPLILRAMRQFTGRNKLVFPSQRYAHRPMSENAIGYL